MSGWGDQPPPRPNDPYDTGQGFGQRPYPPPGYPPYGYYPAPETHSKAIGAVVAAIASYFTCPVVLAIVALMLARDSAMEIATSGGRFTGTGFNEVARVLAWINIALYGGALLVLLAVRSSAS